MARIKLESFEGIGVDAHTLIVGVMTRSTGGPVERARGARHIRCPRESHIPRQHPMPQEPGAPVGGDALPLPGDPVCAAPLSCAVLTLLPACPVAASGPPPCVRGRSTLRMCWDGKARVSWDPRRGLYKPLGVPRRASSLGIVGDDAEGARLLAVVPLPTPDERTAHRASDPAMTLEGGHMAAINIEPGNRSGGTRARICPPAGLHGTGGGLGEDCRHCGDRLAPSTGHLRGAKQRTGPADGGISSRLPVELVVARVVEQPARGAG